MSVSRARQTLLRTLVTRVAAHLLAVGWDYFGGLGKRRVFSRLRFLCMNARMPWPVYQPSHQLITDVEDFASSYAYLTVGLQTSYSLR